MKSSLAKLFFTGLVLTWAGLSQHLPAYTHPGMLHTAADFTRMTTEVNAGAEPWLSGWNKLLANPHSSSTYVMAGPDVTITRTATGGNYLDACKDAAAAYQNALRWKIEGDTACGNESIKIMNAWASTCTGISGDSNMYLASGLQGYQWANAAEIMRGYSGWSATDFSNFKTWMVNVYYQTAHAFMTEPQTCPEHYWANWCLSNMATILSIGILCDNTTYFDEGVNYYVHGTSTSYNGFVKYIVTTVYAGGIDQNQEAGRDVGHATLDLALLGPFCKMAGNQGQYMFDYNPWSEDVSRAQGDCEYTAEYNLGNTVPYTPFVDSCDNINQTTLATGNCVRPIWELLHFQWPNLPNIANNAAAVRPEGGGGDYGTSSGSYDQLGFGTLTYSQ